MTAFSAPHPRPGFVDARADWPCTPIVTTLDHRRPASPDVYVELDDGAVHVIMVPRFARGGAR